MARILGRSLFFCILLALASTARADPLLMFLVTAAKQLASSAAESPAQPTPQPPAPAVYPGTTVEPKILQRLIDDSFLYLTPAQRGEVFQALHTELMKPENFALRGPMIEEFAFRALQVRAAQLRLAKLSPAEKEALAAQFRVEVKDLSEEDRTPLRHALEQRLLPVPVDLNQLLLAQLD